MAAEDNFPQSPVPPIGECGWSVYCHVRKALSEFATWLLQGLDWVFASILHTVWSWFEITFMALVYRVAGPLFETFSNYTSQIPDGVWYMLSMCNASFGLKVVLSAYFIRFMIRRLPFVG